MKASSYMRIKFRVCFVRAKLVSFVADYKMSSQVPLLMIDCFTLATSVRQQCSKENMPTFLSYVNIVCVERITSL